MKLRLCNIHRLALPNEGAGERKPIHVPFGTWDYDDATTQTLDRAHALAIAADLKEKVAAGEPGLPVYQGHPDVPEYAGKYPDKGALGWIREILVNDDGMDLVVAWDRDPRKGFGWFSPYWTGEAKAARDGKREVVVDGLVSVGLVNNPNIREFRLANEALANVTDANGRDHVEAGSPEGGQFAPGESASHTDKYLNPFGGDGRYRLYRKFTAGPARSNKYAQAKRVNEYLKERSAAYHKLSTQKARGAGYAERKRESYDTIREGHRMAIEMGLTYNRSTHLYE